MSATTDCFKWTTTLGVGRDVVDPVPRAVGPGHPGDEQPTIVVVQEDLDPPLLTRPAAGRRQVDDLAVVKGGADGVIHAGSHCSRIAPLV